MACIYAQTIGELRQNSEPILLKRDGTEVTNWSWTYPGSACCWDKFHDFYQPNGLFNSHFHFDKVGKKCKFAHVVFTSTLHQKIQGSRYCNQV
jgi:hypothetical protein